MNWPEHVATVPAALEAWGGKFGSRTALVDGARRLTYAALDHESAKLAAGLISQGVGKGHHVGLLMPNGADWVLAFLAAARIGAVIVPINTFYQSRELRRTLNHGDVETLLMTQRFANHDYPALLEDTVPGLCDQTDLICCPEVPCLRRVFIWGNVEVPWARSATNLLQFGSAYGPLQAGLSKNVVPADRLLLMHTSGSTGEPKAAIHTHGSVIRHSYQLAMTRDLREDDCVWSPMPFFWIGGLVFSLLGALHRGACFVAQGKFDPRATLEIMEKERVTLALAWPHYGRALAEDPSFKARDLSALRGGNLQEILPNDLKPSDPSLRANSLGMTETCGPHTFAEGTLPERLRGSFGPALPGLEHRIENDEILVRGYALMQGLYKEEREDTFDADGFYHTGDSGHFDSEGQLFFTGRLTELIKTAGANVSPAEVETVLLERPEIEQAYVFAIPDPERDQVVGAALVLCEGASVDAEALRVHLKSLIASYKIPSRIFFLERSALPLTDTGKVNRHELSRALQGLEQHRR